MAECDPPLELGRVVSDLMSRNAVTRELGRAALPSAVATFMEKEFELARACFESGRTNVPVEVIRAEAALFYRMVVERREREVR